MGGVAPSGGVPSDSGVEAPPAAEEEEALAAAAISTGEEVREGKEPLEASVLIQPEPEEVAALPPESALLP